LQAITQVWEYSFERFPEGVLRSQK